MVTRRAGVTGLGVVVVFNGDHMTITIYTLLITPIIPSKEGIPSTEGEKAARETHALGPHV